MINKQISKYQITAEIGRTQLATVYRASTPDSSLDYAIKVLNVYLSSEPSFRKAFEEQAQLLSEIEHEWLVPWHEVGEVDNQPYLVMPLMAHSLRERLEKEGALSLEESVKILRHIAGTLDYVHERGLLHLDIKPSNVLFLAGVPRLSDLGIARMMEHTTKATYASTPSQMAPEQWRKRSLDARTDIYQLGVLLFEMLTGQLPFNAYTLSSFMSRHVYDPVPSACKIAPHLPAGCDALLAKAMAKEPAQRFWSAGELLAELIRLSEASAAGVTVEVLQEAQAQAQETQEQEVHLQEETSPPAFILSPAERVFKAQQAQYRLMIQHAIFFKIRTEANLMLERYDSALSDAQRILNHETYYFALHVEEQAKREANPPTIEEVLNPPTIEEVLNPPTIEEVLKEALTSVELEEYDAVIKQTSQALSMNPDDVEVLYMRANAYFEQNEYEKTVEDTTKVLELDPDDIESLLMRAESYMQLEKYEEALIDVEAYLKEEPDSGEAIDLKEKASEKFKENNIAGGCLVFFSLLIAMALFGWFVEAASWFWLFTILLPSLAAYLMSSHKPQSQRQAYGALIWMLGFVLLCGLFFWI